MEDQAMEFVTEQNMALLVDLYELTMAQSYFREGRNEPATFDLFVRNLPPRRGFLVSAGLDTALDYLERLRFPEEGIAYLRGLGLFDEGFLRYLRDFRFTGDVRAIPEGEVFFPPEPVLQITAPRIEGQIVETFLLNQINLQSLIATKAARVVLAARGRPVIDFSPRRDHGTDAALKVARSSYLAGCAGTSNVLAGMLYGIPVYGTMAHSYVMSFEDELEAFRAYARQFPDRCILLIDTYDTLQGARNAVVVARELRERGYRLRGVRIDSGDLATLSREVRAILDSAGFPEVQILASGDLNEDKIAALLEAGAPIDAFGVGTEMGVSYDAPALGGVYKLVEDTAGYRIKRSTGKVTLPGRKQVWRVYREGRMQEDIIALADDPPPPGAEPLLVEVMRGGRRIHRESLEDARRRCGERFRMLPDELRRLDGGRYPVRLSPQLEAVLQAMAGAAF
ncbi:MAG: nicotinate phosphoribosyltransferase [Armatimonadota bacterium]|nr:nicotinate phosphoribosyltransferase [Armatimonadota bacterium]MDR7444793.1 nicotinate phosphoribosyltransferase [Armatimonadota bacterium]MDR7569206.1 nicotinate phosphoribosyltransferase [Armatimonadota bacterium]MDR7613324.1 nicotinate phosphoribosyltransferase [Armatimonadota bacterium]